jgi:hypothetical protein
MLWVDGGLVDIQQETVRLMHDRPRLMRRGGDAWDQALAGQPKIKDCDIQKP